MSDVRLTVDLPPQFNVVQVQSGWFGSDEEWAIPTDVTLRYQTNEDDPNDPWREWVVWNGVTHRRWGLAFVSDLDLPSGVLVSRIQYEFGTVPAGWRWGTGRDGLPRIEGFVTPYGWNGRPIFEGEKIAG